jgi:hypothetical protein
MTDIFDIDMDDRDEPDEREEEPRQLIRVVHRTKIAQRGRPATGPAADAGAVCVNCEGRFRATKMHVGGKLCANCFKAHESIRRTAEVFDGTMRMRVVRPGKVIVTLKCANDHEWTMGLQSRKAKNWCKECKVMRHEEERRAHAEQLEQIRTNMRMQQDRIFHEERERVPPPEEDPHDHEPQGPVDQAMEDEMQEVLMNQIMTQNRAVDPQVQFRVAELFLNVDERTIIGFMQRMADNEQAAVQERTAVTIHQLVQRLRLALHPDKNREHPRAKDAF